MSGRHVIAPSAADTFVRHAVWVPHDLEPVESKVVQRESDGNLYRTTSWRGKAVCGVQVVSIVAGPQRGHDWDRASDGEKCMNCRRTLGQL